MNYNELIQKMTGNNVVYTNKSDLNSNNYCHEENFYGISDYFGNTNKEFIIQNNEVKELYITENGFDYKKYIIDNKNNKIENLITDPIVLSLQNLKKFISDMDIDSFLYSMKPICNIVDSLSREEQYSHVLSKIYGMDYHFYNIIYDALLIAKRYDQLWILKYPILHYKHSHLYNTYKKFFNSEIINIKLFCNKKFINSVEFLNIINITLKGTTPFIRKHYNMYCKCLEQNLLTYYNDNGQNFIEFYIDKWINGDKPTFYPYINLYKQFINKRHYNSFWATDTFIENNLCSYKINNRDLFYFHSGYKYQYIELHNLFFMFFALISQEFLRDSENILREEMNIPKICESWVSETELYYLIKTSFPNTIVQHHGKPDWLGRQHLDIYMPEFNIAIEYQGKQHFEPVEYFGGIDGYNETIKRDKRKQKLCQKNNCELIYVMEGYEPVKIVNKIADLIKKSICN